MTKDDVTLATGSMTVICVRSEPNEPIKAAVTFKPQDQTFEACHRIGLIVQGSNTVWAVPDDPGAGYTLRFGRGSALELPLS